MFPVETGQVSVWASQLQLYLTSWNKEHATGCKEEACSVHLDVHRTFNNIKNLVGGKKSGKKRISQ